MSLLDRARDAAEFVEDAERMDKQEALTLKAATTALDERLPKALRDAAHAFQPVFVSLSLCAISICLSVASPGCADEQRHTPALQGVAVV